MTIIKTHNNYSLNIQQSNLTLFLTYRGYTRETTGLQTKISNQNSKEKKISRELVMRFINQISIMEETIY